MGGLGRQEWTVWPAGENLETGMKLQKLRADMEMAMLHFEATSVSLKKRHAYILADRKSQVENLKVKQKLEKDKSDLQLEVDDHLTHAEQMT